MLMSRRGSGLSVTAFKAEYLIGAVIAASIGFSTAQAASFGHSRIVSAPGRPLHIEIPVSQLTQQELDSLRATPAPAAAWQQAGMTPPVALESMQLVLLDGYRPDTKVIQLRSEQPTDQPIVDVLLDIRSASGKQRYQVSLLAHADLNAIQRAGGENLRNPRAIDGRAVSRSPGGHARAGARISVRNGDNMFAIAQRNAVQGVTVYQMMIALQRANRQAFIEDNVNLVKAGATLAMPDIDALTALSDREARRIFQQHAQAFARYRQRSGATNITTVSAAAAASAQGNVSPDTPVDSGLAAAPETSGDRLRLSGGPGAGGTTSGNGAAGLGGSNMGVAPTAAGHGRNSGSLLAASGVIASDAVTDRAPDALSGDMSGLRSGVLASETVAMADASSATRDPDDDAALRKGTEESQKRVLELEDNVRHLNEALQKQGHVAAEAALEGARSVSEAIKEAIGLYETDGEPRASGDSTASSATDTASSRTGTGPEAEPSNEAGASLPNGAESNSATSNSATSSGTASNSAASNSAASNSVASNNGAAPAAGMGAATESPRGPGSAPSSAQTGISASIPGGASTALSTAPGVNSSTASGKAEREVSWFQNNLLAAVGGGLLLLVLIVVWLLRRASAAKRDAFESDSPITDTMVREKLRDIDLDLDQPSDPASHRVS